MPQENWKDKFLGKLQQFFDKPVHDDYHFTLSSPYAGEVQTPTTNEIQENEKAFDAKDIFASLPVNLEYIKVKY